MLHSNKKYKAMKNNNVFASHQKNFDSDVPPRHKAETKSKTETAEKKIQTFLMITQYSQWGLTTNI